MASLHPRQTTFLAAGLGVAAVLLSILFLDRPVADWAHTLHRPVWCVWLTRIADLPGPGSLGILAGSLVAWLFGWKPGAIGRLLIAVCLATLAAGAGKDLLKFGFGRPWPETWVNNNPSWIGSHTYGFAPFHGGQGWASFPSGHTTMITTPCAALWRSAGRWRPPLLLLPVLVALGLIGSDFHFLGDCLAGMLLGIAFGAAPAAIQADAAQM